MGQRLKDRRRALGITALDLAQQVGVREGTILRWEAGVHVPGLRHALKLAKALDVRVDELLLDGAA